MLEKAVLRLREKAVAAALQAPEGDFRDWDAIDAWSREIAERLRAGPT